MAKYGSMIAKALPPPGKLPKGPMEPDADDMPSSDEDEDHAAKLSAAESFQQATKNGTADDVLQAFEDLMGVCKGY